MNQERLDQFLGKALNDLGASVSAVLISLGDSLGYYRALAVGQLTAAELAAETDTNERYAREWLGNQVAGGYVDYDPVSRRYFLNAEQRACLADPQGPVDLPAAYEIVRDLFHVRDRAIANFSTGEGMEWGEHDKCLFSGTERFFRASYRMYLLQSWLPAFDGLTTKLQRGGRVADIGCGHGASTLLMARAFPHSEFIGIDYHPASIAVARRHAAHGGVNNVRFEVADASSYDVASADLVAFFDCLHDMSDPAGAALHARESLKPGGHCMIVEPLAGDGLEQNLNPVGRLYYGVSTLVCVPVSLAGKGPALGAQAGESSLRKVLTEGGFSQIRRAAQTPFNMVLEARP